jgi:hypothetical protein
MRISYSKEPIFIIQMEMDSREVSIISGRLNSISCPDDLIANKTWNSFVALFKSLVNEGKGESVGTIESG